MVDRITPEKRSRIMSKIPSKNTKPEILVRKWLHSQGYRFRLHPKDLPGKPDIVLPKYKTAIFVHGCFWHGHPSCKNAKRPDQNAAFWNAKIDRNMERDSLNMVKMKGLGWKVLVIWECMVYDKSFTLQLKDLKGAFLNDCRK